MILPHETTVAVRWNADNLLAFHRHPKEEHLCACSPLRQAHQPCHYDEAR